MQICDMYSLFFNRNVQPQTSSNAQQQLNKNARQRTSKSARRSMSASARPSTTPGEDDGGDVDVGDVDDAGQRRMVAMESPKIDKVLFI